MNTREYWVKTLLKISKPVFSALAEGKLREKMPVESGGDGSYANKNKKAADQAAIDNRNYAPLQALGRSLAGTGPWLNLAGLKGDEAKQQKELRRLVIAGIGHATNRRSPDFMNFETGVLPLCDAASFAHGLLRSWDSVWVKLDRDVQKAVVECLKLTRTMKAYHCNWLLFPTMIEAFLCKAGEDWDWMRVEYAIQQHQQWYLGDGHYGDGPFFHWDYYNSYVIHPMLLGIVDTVSETTGKFSEYKDTLHRRARRYAAIQERLIATDGTFPPIGRSLAYRTGAFHCLADMTFRHELPEEITPAQVRCALTAVMKRMLEKDDTFNAQGWLRVGFYGHQPSIGEDYMCTGALYLCTYAFLPLGLPAKDAFWTEPEMDWTSKRIWAGGKATSDHAMKEP